MGESDDEDEVLAAGVKSDTVGSDGADGIGSSEPFLLLDENGNFSRSGVNEPDLGVVRVGDVSGVSTDSDIVGERGEVIERSGDVGQVPAADFGTISVELDQSAVSDSGRRNGDGENGSEAQRG